MNMTHAYTLTLFVPKKDSICVAYFGVLLDYLLSQVNLGSFGKYEF